MELLRSCTAEPRKTGTIWTVEKDITRYSSLLKSPQTLAVYLANIVDDTYTGVYHVNLTLHFYPVVEDNVLGNGELGVGDSDRHADLILPISRDLSLGDALWFSLQNSSDHTQGKEFSVPRNTYRAMLEVFVSFHSSDEFWYGNAPNDYISANNLSIPGNGPFREVVVSLDDVVVGAVWPFTVIYTGGVNPLLWRPITGIGSYDLPTYEIEITPFLGKILDGKTHKFGFCVTNGLNVWFVDANLHLWLDDKSSRTEGKLIEYRAEPAKQSSKSNFKGLEGTFLMRARRFISSTGWVKTCKGIITTHAYQRFVFQNKMEYKNDGNLQIVRQTIDAYHGVDVKFPSMVMQSTQLHQNFQLYLFSDYEELSSDSFSENDNLSLSFNEERFSGGHFGLSYSSLYNFEHGRGYMNVTQSKVTDGLGSTRQIYRYNSKDDCYDRDVSVRNYTILHDNSGTFCGKGSSESRGLPFTARRVSLASGLQVPNRRN